MNSTARQSPANLVAEVHASLADCVDSVPKVSCAFLATCDGHLIHLYGSVDEATLEDHLPMAGSILGLGRAVVDGLEKESRLDDVIVRSGRHVISLVGVGDESDVLFLGVFADRMVNLGQLLVKSRQAAERIKLLL